MVGSEKGESKGEMMREKGIGELGSWSDNDTTNPNIVKLL